MTVPSQNTRVTYTASGSSDTFAYPFRILSSADLLVYIDDVLQTLTTDYSVTGVDAEDGGNVVFTSNPAAASVVVIMRDMDYGRTAFDYQNAGDFKALTVNRDFDSLAMQIQQLANLIARAPLLSVATTIASLAFPDPVAGGFIQWNSLGTALQAVATQFDGELVTSVGTSTPRSQAERFLQLGAAEDEGAIGDGINDDYSALQAQLNRGFLTLQKGKIYNIGNNTLHVNTHGTVIYGNNATIKYTGTGDAVDATTLSGIYPQNCAFRDISVDCTNSVTSGIRWRFSYSYAINCTVTIRASTSTAWRIDTDFTGGTGPYYNSFFNCHATGKVGVTAGVANQTGWLFTSSNSAPTRGPNANTFFPGRTSDMTSAWVICGAGNNIISPKVEGTASGGFVFTFENTYGGASPSAACFRNSVTGGYVEGGAGANLVKFGTSSYYNQVKDIYVTSLGGGTLVTDSSGNNTNQYHDELSHVKWADFTALPTIAGSVTPGSQTYSIRSARCSRTNGTAFIKITLVLSALDGATNGLLKITNLEWPATANSNNYASITVSDHNLNLSAGYTQVAARIDPGANFLYLVEMGDNVATQVLTHSALSSSSEIIIGGSYEV